jgi:hypothetical protein
MRLRVPVCKRVSEALKALRRPEKRTDSILISFRSAKGGPQIGQFARAVLVIEELSFGELSRPEEHHRANATRKEGRQVIWSARPGHAHGSVHQYRITSRAGSKGKLVGQKAPFKLNARV